MKKANKIYYGGDYNPDQWDDQTIAEDMKFFKEANINLLTLPVFSWAKLEPDEGVYQFEWLDKIIDKIWQHGIHICLATPTTAQPAWLSARYPEVLPVDIKGRKRTHGMRVFFCVNSLRKWPDAMPVIHHWLCGMCLMSTVPIVIVRPVRPNSGFGLESGMEQ